MLNTTTTLEKETIEGLQDLIQINLDSQKGFQTAIEAVEDPQLEQLFTSLQQDRANFAGVLQDYVVLNGAEPEVSGSAKGALHRWWTSLRGKITSDNAYPVLAEAERGEDAIKAKYEEVLKTCAGNPLNDVLLEQYRVVKMGHDRVRDLRDAYKTK